MPPDAALPPFFLLGSSDFGATCPRRWASASASPPISATSTRRAPCSPTAANSSPGERPHAILTVQAIVADTEEEAQRLATSVFVSFARLRTGQKALLLPPDEAADYPFSPQEAAVALGMRARILAGTPDDVRTGSKGSPPAPRRTR